jgi:hypothetical protein
MRHHLLEIRKLNPLEVEETEEHFSEPEERAMTFFSVDREAWIH